MLENFKNWKTTITGFLVALLPIAIMFKLISQDEGNMIIEQCGGIIEAIGAIIGSVGAIILVFKAKDA